MIPDIATIFHVDCRSYLLAPDSSDLYATLCINIGLHLNQSNDKDNQVDYQSISFFFSFWIKLFQISSERSISKAQKLINTRSVIDF